MFWNVRPMPAWTMSFGRALLKTPNRVQRRSYQGGRMMAVSRLATSTPIAIVMVSRPTSRLLGSTSTQAMPPMRKARIAGASHTNGSSHVRSGRAIIRRPLNSTTPDVGSRIPATMLKKVVLPAPFGPMRLTIEPFGMMRSALFTATRPPKRLVTDLACSTMSRSPSGRFASGVAAGVVEGLPGSMEPEGVMGSLIAHLHWRADRSGPDLPHRRRRVHSWCGARQPVAGSGRGPPAAAASSPRAPVHTAGTGTGRSRCR